MEITSTTTWTVTKDGVSIDLTTEDIHHLLDCMVWSDEVIVFDEASGCLGAGPDEIGVSLNGSAIQFTLFEEGTDE